MKTPIASSIGGKIIGGFLALLGILLIIGWMANAELKSIENLVSQQIMEKAYAHTISKDILLKSVSVFGYVKEYTALADETKKRELRIIIKDDLRTIQEDMAQVSPNRLTVEEKNIYDLLLGDLALYRDRLDMVLTTYDREGGVHGQTTRLVNEFGDLHAHFITLLLKFDSIETELMYASWDDAKNKIGSMKTYILVLSVIAVFLAVLLGILMTRSVTRPISRLADVLERYASGDFSVRAEVHSNDEIGYFSDRFNVMLDQLQAGRQQLLDIIDFLPDATFVIDSHRRVIAWNHATEEMTGVRKEEILGKGDFTYAVPFYGHARPIMADLVFGPDPAAESKYASLERKGNIVFAETSVTFLDGRTAYLFGTASPLFDNNGSIIGAIESLRDITERKKMEDALHKNEEFLNNIIENIPDMIFVKDAQELRFARFNKAGEELLGYPRGDLIGKNDYDFFPKDEADFFTSKDRDVLSGRTLMDIPEEPIKTRYKGERILHTKKIPILDREGKAQYLLGISEDITARKLAEKEILRLNAELEQRVADRTAQLEAANKELEAFSYSVSHDLRAPLRSIDGFSQALLEEYSPVLDEQGKDFLRRVRDSARRMEQLIDDMLMLSRVTRSEMRCRAIDLGSMALSIAAGLRAGQPERAVEFEIDQGLVVNADENLMRIVLENLLGNAWKFTGTHAAARIEVGSMRQEGQEVYFVRDNGAGFDMAFADRLFGAFQRLHTTDEFEGTGVGLATVQRIIHRHGGRIWAHGEVGKGATVYFTVPD